MRREPHPINGTIYEELGDGVVRVTDSAHDKWGKFKWDGTWLEGEITYADPHLLLYVGGQDLPPGRDLFWMVLPPDNDPAQPLLTPEQERAMAQAPREVCAYTPDPGMETPEGTRSIAHIDADFFIANDRKPELIPGVYKRKSPMPGGPVRIPVERYFSKQFHDLEVAHIWRRTWQMACREDDIPNIGDHHVYEIANLSFLIVRTGEHEIKAHYNACLHRGRLLRERDGKAAKEFRCPFHGWAWRIDGSLKDITAEWDFPGVREEVCQLPGAKVAIWAGFVFINPDPGAESFEAFAGPEMLEQYAKFHLEQRYKHAHVTRVIKANWKLVMEAFMEAYHVIATHPQQLFSNGDLVDTRYDVFGNWARAGNAQGGGSSALRGVVASKERSLDEYYRGADGFRAYLAPLLGEEALAQYSDVELKDGSFNNLYPNLAPWGGWGRIVFRFRPSGENPDESLFDVMLLAPWPAGKPKPPTVAHRILAHDEAWTNAPELGSLGKILDQDVRNLPYVHAGVKTKQPPYVIFSAYQEGIIRNFHRNYERALGLSDGLEN